MAPLKIFELVGIAFSSPRLGVIFFLTTLLISLSLPVIWAMKKLYSQSNFVLMLLLIGPTSIPALITLDRGNTVGFLPPIIFYFVLSIIKNNKIHSSVAILLLSFIKPHFILLALIFVIFKSIRPLIVVPVASFSFHFLAFMLWPLSFPRNIGLYTNIF